MSTEEVIAPNDVKYSSWEEHLKLFTVSKESIQML